jgi:4-diphosphocytidyl-2-C-methyl-D-erythritol kinase
MVDFVDGAVENDCLDVVLSRYPAVADAFDWLGRNADAARLTGTGSCIFAVCTDEQDARRIASSAPARYAAFAARGCNRSPLFGA